MIGVPVIINHQDVSKENADEIRRGVVSDVWYNPVINWFECAGVIWDKTAQNLITDKGWSVSCSYDVKLADDAGGTENNIPYDIEFLDGVFTHLAIVDNPRYERANIVFNSKTVVQNFDPNQKRDKKGRWTRENYNAEIDKILKGELKSADVIKVAEHPSEPWLKAGLQDAEMLMSVKTYDKATTDKHNVSEKTMRNLPDLINDPLYIFKSSTVPGSYVGVLDDYEEENGAKKPLIAVVKPEHGKIDVNLIPSVYGKDPDFPYREVFKNNLLYERLDKNKTVSNNIIASIAMETLKPSDNIITDIQDDFNPNMKKNVQNNKEQDMALLDELKKLITKVENDKGEDMDDKEKVENEKVDKREYIRKIMALVGELGGTDEQVRTAAGWAEKISYDESEAGTADNKKAKNEKEDEPKDDKPTDNSKVKNESEEDNKKYEDLKKDIKEDVENKCKNSVENSKNGGYFDKMNEIYNSANEPKEENLYISREQKLKDAETYFAK